MAMPAANAQMNGNASQDLDGLSLGTLAFRLIKAGMRFVLRCNITLILIAYNAARTLVEKVWQPLEPIAVEVRKVPKKDISIEGIFYQFLRLQFLFVLYVWPIIVYGIQYVCQPLVRLKDWMVRYVQDEEDSWKRSDPSVLKEG